MQLSKLYEDYMLILTLDELNQIMDALGQSMVEFGGPKAGDDLLEAMTKLGLKIEI